MEKGKMATYGALRIALVAGNMILPDEYIGVIVKYMQKIK